MKRTAILFLGLVSACGGNGGRLGGPSIGAGTAGTFGGAGAGGPGTAGTGAKPGEVVLEVSQTVNRDLDILFMVDNSIGMKVIQQKLAANFPSYASVLKGLPGGLPNLHLAVVTSDIGAGAFDVGDIPSCRHGGDQGIFQNMPRGTTCATGMLNAGERFITSINGQTNFTGSLEDVFGCISQVGDLGCGYEHQLGSTLRALGADGAGPPPAENAGFLRESALLAVVLVTDEDDCSAPINSTVFDPTSRLVSDPLGPLTSYRCNELGHVCGGAKPPRTPAGPTDLSGTCTSAEDGKLLRIADVAARLKGLKADPGKILVSVVAGPPTPYIVDLFPPSVVSDPTMWPAIRHSCVAADGTDADPAIRLRELVDAFGGNGVFQEICNQSFMPALQRIAEEIGQTMGPPCLTAKVVDATPATTAVEPDCTVVDHERSANGVRIDTPLRRCVDASDTTPCWGLTPGGPTCPAGSQAVTFQRPGPASGTELTTTVTCKVCKANDTRPGCAY